MKPTPFGRCSQAGSHCVQCSKAVVAIASDFRRLVTTADHFVSRIIHGNDWWETVLAGIRAIRCRRQMSALTWVSFCPASWILSSRTFPCLAPLAARHQSVVWCRRRPAGSTVGFVSKSPANPSQTFPRKLRLRTQAEFDRVYRTKVFAADDVLVINAGASELSHARLGLSVSKKVGNAVTRNRWKRLIREAFRLSQHELPAGIDLVARPQKGAKPELAAIRKSLAGLVRRVAKRAVIRPPASNF